MIDAGVINFTLKAIYILKKARLPETVSGSLAFLKSNILDVFAEESYCNCQIFSVQLIPP